MHFTVLSSNKRWSWAKQYFCWAHGVNRYLKTQDLSKNTMLTSICFGSWLWCYNSSLCLYHILLRNQYWNVFCFHLLFIPLPVPMTEMPVERFFCKLKIQTRNSFFITRTPLECRDFFISHCNIINIELVSRLSTVEAASIHFSSHLTVNDRESRCLQTVFFLEPKEAISCLDSSSLFWTSVFVRFEVVY